MALVTKIEYHEGSDSFLIYIQESERCGYPLTATRDGLNSHIHRLLSAPINSLQELKYERIGCIDIILPPNPEDVRAEAASNLNRMVETSSP